MASQDAERPEKPEEISGGQTGQEPSLPMVSVSWYDAVMFCNWLSRQEGRDVCYQRDGKEKIRDYDNTTKEYDAWKLIPVANGYRLPSEDGTSAWTILLGQFKSPLIYIILAAAAISLALGEYGDFAIIMAVVVIDVVLGFVQEFQAQKTSEIRAPAIRSARPNPARKYFLLFFTARTLRKHEVETWGRRR